MPGWIESLLVRVISSLISKMGALAQNTILDIILKSKTKKKQEERAEVVEEIEAERLKPEQEQSDDKLRELHRRLRNIDS